MSPTSLLSLGYTADAAAHRQELQSNDAPAQTVLGSLVRLPSFPPFNLCASSTPAATEAAPSKDSSVQKQTSLTVPPAASNQGSIYSSSDDEVEEEDENKAKMAQQGPPLPKRSSRPKTIYQIAHPVLHHRRLRLRPQLLFQLQRFGPTSRPVPIYDVLPAATVPRLARKFPRLFEAVKGFGPTDVLVVTSDMYEPPALGEDDRSISSDDSRADHREVVATICRPAKDEPQNGRPVEIYIHAGGRWEGRQLPNGSYEFVSQGDQRQKVRWVLRDKANRRASTSSSLGSTSGERGSTTKRFTFSVINPNTRRHPVLASLTSSNIEVFDQYTIPSDSGAPEEAEAGGRQLATTDEHQRTLIVMTGVWVALAEGWSKTFWQPETHAPDGATGPQQRRSMTMLFPRDESTAAPSPGASPPPASAPISRSGTITARSMSPSSPPPETRESATDPHHHHHHHLDGTRALPSSSKRNKSRWRRISAMFGKHRT
ncbi:hypothetical protein VTN31DRAFT_5982 [Thermomyces dupontii]|uniref:uncharacterized protein n=1 Tax=Talaromyces thermophilus TaxID=28565 RepID=UPI0037435DA4